MITLLLATLLGRQAGSPVFACGTLFDHRRQFILSEPNRLRAEQGLSQLRLNYKLCAMARSHRSNMAGTGYLSHTDSLGRDCKERLGNKTVERYPAGENVATGNFPTPPASRFKVGARVPSI